MSATTATEESKLTLGDVARVSELKDLGWNAVEKDGQWWAHEQSGDLRDIGPAKSVKALRTQVDITLGVSPNGKTHKVGSSKLQDGEFTETGDSETKEIVPDFTEIELAEDSKGNTYLPGTTPRVNGQLASSALRHYRVKTERMALTKEEKEAKDELIEVSKVHRNLFTKNTEGKLTYMAGDIEIEYIHEEKDNVKTKLIGDDIEDD